MRDGEGSLEDILPPWKEVLSLLFNAEKRTFTLIANVRKLDLTDPDAGIISTAVTIGDKGFLNTQAWRLEKGLKGKQLVTPVRERTR